MQILKSKRFQALIVLALIGFFEAQGWVPSDIAVAFYTILGGHIGIRTIDRIGDKISK